MALLAVPVPLISILLCRLTFVAVLATRLMARIVVFVVVVLVILVTVLVVRRVLGVVPTRLVVLRLGPAWVFMVLWLGSHFIISVL